MAPACAALDEVEPPHLRRGDWLVRPDGRVASQLLDFDAPALQEDAALTLGDPVPLRTVSCIYCGRAALGRHEGPRLRIRIYHLVEGFVPH